MLSGVPVQVLATLLSIQLPANVFEKATDDDLNAWVPITHMGDLEEAPHSWLWLGPALANATFWGIN